MFKRKQANKEAAPQTAMARRKAQRGEETDHRPWMVLASMIMILLMLAPLLLTVFQRFAG